MKTFGKALYSSPSLWKNFSQSASCSNNSFRPSTWSKARKNTREGCLPATAGPSACISNENKLMRILLSGALKSKQSQTQPGSCEEGWWQSSLATNTTQCQVDFLVQFLQIHTRPVLHLFL